MRTLSEQLRTAVCSSNESKYRIAKETGISESSLSRFMNRKASLSMSAIDKIGEYLSLTITTEFEKVTSQK